MSAQIEDARLEGVKVIKPAVHGDGRGWFQESYRDDWSDALGLFVQDNHVLTSRRGVVRGLHFQFPNPQAKLIRVIEGEILDVAVDIRRNSKTFGQYITVKLSEQNHKQLLVPHGFAHGYASLSDRVQVLYKVDAYYDATADLGLAWDDPTLAIDWQITDDPVLSEKDKRWPKLAEFISPF